MPKHKPRRRLAKKKDQDLARGPAPEDEELEIWDPKISAELKKLPNEEKKFNAIERGGSFLLTLNDIKNIDKCLVHWDNYWEVVVLSIDIRKSSIALSNVEDFSEFSQALTDFICYIKNN